MNKKTAIVTFGRFNPPTQGHQKLVDKVLSVAVEENASPLIYVSHSHDSKKNPLSYEDKIKFMRMGFGKIVVNSNARTIIEVLKELSNTYDNITVVVGEDRVKEFSTLLNAYNNKEYNYENIKVISAGERDPDAEDVTGMSASKMRKFASEGNLEMFKGGLPTRLQKNAKEIYTAVLKGMKIMEDNVMEEIEEAAPLSISQRRRRAMTMRRYANKIRVARERARKRKATPEKLKKRAQRKALDFIRQRLMKSKKYSEMSTPEKVALDKRLARVPKTAIERIARKLLPKVRQAEIQRLSDLHKTKEESYDINGLFEQFINEPESPRKKKFRYLFTREGKVNFDGRYKMYRPRNVVSESIETFEDELCDLIESVETFIEGRALERVKNTIQTEKDADKRKHQRMIKRARQIDRVRFESVDKTDPKNREYGTDSLVKILKKDTPGENVEGGYYADRRKQRSKNEELDLDLRTVNESTSVDNILNIVHKHVLNGENLMDIVWNIGQLAAVDIPVKKIYNMYIDKYGNPLKSKIDISKANALKAKYGVSTESKLYEAETCPILTAAHMKAFEQFVDKMFEKFGIDFEFTRHFRERMSHERNDPCIDMKELAAMIQKIYKKYQHGEKSLNKFVDAEAVIKDLQTNLNMPIAVEYDRKNDELVVIAKTIMRKKNFSTPNPVVKV